MSTNIYIKNMVCNRCIMAVKDTLRKMDIPFSEVNLGLAVVDKELLEEELSKLDKELKDLGFELVKDQETALVEQVKALIVDYIHYHTGEELKVNFSDYLSDKIGRDYTFLSRLFSDIENTTIEKFIILQRIERVKELISYDELNFSEIAYRLNYSSVSHLSKQFKTVTGLTLTAYKNLKSNNRKPLDMV